MERGIQKEMCGRTQLNRLCVTLLIAWAAGAVCVHAVTIQSVQIPRYVENGSASVELDCEFVRGERDEHLVLKWFHSADASPVFQWIPEHDLLQASGVFAGHVDADETRRLSSARATALTSHFVVRLLRPVIAHEGRYRCYATSVANTDDREHDLTVYVPPRAISLRYNAERHTMVCRVEHVYPLANVTLYRVSKKSDLEEEADHVKREDRLNDDGTFDVLLRKYVGQPPRDPFECWAFLDLDYKVLAKAHYTADRTASSSSSSSSSSMMADGGTSSAAASTTILRSAPIAAAAATAATRTRCSHCTGYARLVTAAVEWSSSLGAIIAVQLLCVVLTASCVGTVTSA